MRIESPSQLRLAEVQTLAIETFGSKTKADIWLNQVNFILGVTPISLADSDYGLLEVKRLLSSITYGAVV